MNVLFNPPQLQAARQASALQRIANDIVEPKVPAELRVLKKSHDSETHVVFITEGREPASFEFPGDWLYSDISEEELREQLAGLVGRGTPH
jgi:hypothetical protein